MTHACADPISNKSSAEWVQNACFSTVSNLLESGEGYGGGEVDSLCTNRRRQSADLTRYIAEQSDTATLPDQQHNGSALSQTKTQWNGR